MPIPTTAFDSSKTIIVRKTFAKFTPVVNGTPGTAVSLVGKMLNMENPIEEVRREVPDANGHLRPDRIEITKMGNIFKYEVEDVKLVAGIFGGLQGGSANGKVEFWVVDPKDASGKVAVHVEEHDTYVKMDGGLNLAAGEVAKATLTFEALEAITMAVDATIT